MKCKHCGLCITLCEGDWLHCNSMMANCPPIRRTTVAAPDFAQTNVLQGRRDGKVVDVQ